MQTNSSVFFYELCNLWQSHGATSKNFQCFFIFGNDESETYFKVPNLSLKIKTKSDFDNTEVKLYATFETLPIMLNMMKEYINTKQPLMRQLSGQRYTFFLSRFLGADQLEYVTIKLTDGNGSTNDYIMAFDVFANFVKILDYTYNDIIRLSLDFIKIAQNNAILKQLTALNSSMKILPSILVPKASDVVNEPYVLDQNNLPIYTDTLSAAVKVEEAPLEHLPAEESISTSEFKPIDMSGPSKTEQEAIVSKAEESFKEEAKTDLKETKSNPLQDSMTNFVKDELVKSPDVKLKDKVLSYIIGAFKGENTLYQAVLNTFRDNALMIPASEGNTFLDMSKYVSLSHSSMIRYIKKLELITGLYKSVKGNVPLFIMECRFKNKFLEIYGIVSKAIFELYLEYRTKENKTEQDEYIYSALRYTFAPFWSTYLSLTNEYDSQPDSFPSKVRQMAFAILQTWRQNWEKQIDSFIYNNKLALNYKGSTVEKIFSSFCPTVYECFINEETITVANTSMVKDIITQLEETFAYEEITFKKEYDLSVLSDEFIINIKSFSKSNNITDETPESTILNYRLKVSTNEHINNIREEFKSLQALDSHDNFLEKNNKETN